MTIINFNKKYQMMILMFMILMNLLYSGMPPIEGDDEEVKEGKGFKILTPNKLLIRLPILLAQIKAGNNSYKLKNEII